MRYHSCYIWWFTLDVGTRCCVLARLAAMTAAVLRSDAGPPCTSLPLHPWTASRGRRLGVLTADNQRRA